MIKLLKSLFTFPQALPAIVCRERPSLGDDLITIQAMILRQIRIINSQLYDADISDSQYEKSMQLISQLILVKTQLHTIADLESARTMAQFTRAHP